ncbi:hypothetical protein [Gordonibacter massiliensis (ex Traore et al. 2017)]|uniref:hypothetical protein n=1 Tax=Gordonibacter massiliensis (ex Traore et al. 2017) TaxID=1841863 RepID=UPI001C8C5507|nr:hypothetical protein [Gordonibacter massiliensis (ex Traore et al. 2017)]MBX9033758.1 hypothetical protein [Gordonibacter massiliensis (ex Traore et al. 2017)]
MDVAISIISASAVIGAAIISGLYSRDKATRVLKKIEVLEKRKESVSAIADKDKRSEGIRLIERLEDSINRDVFYISGNDFSSAVSIVIGLLASVLCFILLYQAFSSNDGIVSFASSVASTACLVVACISLYSYVIPGIVRSLVDKRYDKFVKSSSSKETSEKESSKKEARKKRQNKERGPRI